MSGSVFKRGLTWSYKIPIRKPNQAYGTLWKGGFRTRREAEAAKVKAESDRDSGIDVSPSRLTVGGWLERWLRDYAATLEPKTYAGYATLLRNHIVPRLGMKKLKELRPPDIQACYTAILAKGLSAKTALNTHRAFREALHHAYRQELIGRNPADLVEAPRSRQFEPNVPTLGELKRLIAALDNHPHGELFRLCLWTGLREGELLRLRWQDVQLGRSLLTVQKAKFGSTGTLALTPESVRRLIKHRLNQHRQAQALGPGWQENDLVFPSAIGTPLDAGNLRRSWGKLRDELGMESRIHDFRHTHASLLILAGLHSKQIQARLRHKSHQTTMDVYGHLMADIDAPGLERLDELLVAD